MKKNKTRKYNEKLKRQNKKLKKYLHAEEYRAGAWERAYHVKEQQIDVLKAHIQAQSLLTNLIIKEYAVSNKNALELKLDTNNIAEQLENTTIETKLEENTIIYSVKVDK